MEKKTPLYNIHAELNAKMVPFAGYSMPIQYVGIKQEHMAVRQGVGLFDVSHMGEILITGEKALEYINLIFTNDFTQMPDGKVRYSLMCNSNGGIVDDLVVYKFDENRFMAVVNASNKDKDFEHMSKLAFDGVCVEDVSDSYAQLALQGPMAQEVLAKLAEESSLPQKYYSFIDKVNIDGVECLVSQTGYTGEFGYEIYCDANMASKLWEAIMQAGKSYSILPCGLGARDTLRLEASMPLYGHEMSEQILPPEVGLMFAVKMQKTDFIGKKAIEGTQTSRVRVGIKALDRGVIREQQPVFVGEKQVGITTSGTHCPYLDGVYAMALIENEYAEIGADIEIEVRGKKLRAQIVQLPFYKREK